MEVQPSTTQVKSSTTPVIFTNTGIRIQTGSEQKKKGLNIYASYAQHIHLDMRKKTKTELAKPSNSHLTPIMIEEITDPMSVDMAMTHFSEPDENIMRVNGDDLATSIWHDIRNGGYRTIKPVLWQRRRILYALRSNDISDPHDPRFYNIILEEEALKFRPCYDEMKAASIRHSKISLTDRVKRTYNIGEYIRVMVTLYDGYGKRKCTGGDHLRATIENRALNAPTPCIVTDNNDGMQTVACEALWSGISTISVTLAYTRETITSIFRIRTQLLATRTIGIKFSSRNYSEVTACHPNDKHLLNVTSYTVVCNLTYINAGIPFYCGKPKDKHLRCQDMQSERAGIPSPKFNLTQCENILLERGQQALEQTLAVKILNKNGGSQGLIIDKPSTPCSMYNIRLLWQSRVPTGFFVNGKWILRNCIGFQQTRYKACLRNRRLYMYGDSTTRAWYKAVLKRFNCQHITEKWTNKKWRRDSECFNKQINFKAGWYPHVLPYLARSLADTRDTSFSTNRRIDSIPRNTHAIVVIHIFMHMVAFHHSVFKQRMELIRISVDKFLKHNKQSVVMIKAPHTYEDTPAGKSRLSDYFGYVFRKLLYEVFEGLHDRVVLLNNRDRTIAQHVKWNHPPENIINAMIDQMLSYACDK